MYKTSRSGQYARTRNSWPGAICEGRYTALYRVPDSGQNSFGVHSRYLGYETEQLVGLLAPIAVGFPSSNLPTSV